ncbi:alkaline phosphatase D family protein [Streptantibioticus silvisoli]|uniref:Alkaline phosphatase D family protein n=1 Tax=Streptantibioticus silvisoli TaxID=2705255 RepID=A0ABT6VYB1_9ACTN|nr:alkaline phosphatase D family protein [Streptantibioticus silvisoli]MDI5963019.1 alkaline phosphatase D family protein [Streptantibioticus silvisoli]
MAELRLGPVLRYVDDDSATVWVETDGACEARVVCDDGTAAAAASWCVAGHHYALVVLTGLAPGRETGYTVELDGERVWPLPDSPYPPSTVRTRPSGGDGELCVAFGSCRWSAPASEGTDRIGPDALDTLARTYARGSGGRLPDLMLLLGDQVYADETSPATQRWLAARRDLDEPPWTQVADYEEYTRLYAESWLDPGIRWLLSCVPSYMVFDDHDVIDDWNTSQAWLEDIRRQSWWADRVTGGMMSYWVYQHLGNLSPRQLAEDPLYAAVRAAGDGTAELRRFAEGADRDRAGTRWSYRRDIGRVRIVVVDSRSARVLEEGKRAMLDDGEAAWLREQVLKDRDYDHLLVGTSLPWLLPHGIHAAESWDEALCAGVRGPRWARLGERLRRAADMEHWAAFRSSFDTLADLLGEVAGPREDGTPGPATVCVLSGDVHHGYAAQARRRDGAQHPSAGRVFQLTCSPVHNSVPAAMRLGFRVGWSWLGKGVGALLSRHGRLPRLPVAWRRLGGPWFGNQFMTLTVRDRAMHLRLHQVAGDTAGSAKLITPFESTLSGRPSGE